MSQPLPDEFYRAKLVPELQKIQEQFGYLDRKAMEQFAAQSETPLYRLQEVASFFPHFNLTPPKKVTVRVCRDMACHMAGSAQILVDLPAKCGEQVAVEGVSCLGRCDRAPAACVSIVGEHEELYYLRRSADALKEIVARCLAGEPPAPDTDIDFQCLRGASRINPYEGMPDYQAVRKALAARDASLDATAELLRTTKNWDAERLDRFRLGAVRQLRGEAPPDDVVKEIRAWQTENNWADAFFNEMKDADLRGLGGAGIPAIQKWKDVRDAVRNLRRRDQDDRAFIVVNGDESEPGTFKDRELLLRTPHLIVEAVILAGLTTEATQGFIYIRHEYHEQNEACRAEIKRAEELGFCGTEPKQLGRPFPVSVFVSPGGYICGEQSALIEAMSDRRGEPRNLPPKLETNGLEDRPTLVSNVETYAWTPFIWLKGGKTYATEGVNGWNGRRLFSVSGDVNRPGVYEVPMGLTLRDLIHGEQYCQGIVGGKKMKAFAPSGPSGGFLPAKLRAGGGLPRDHVNNKSWQELAARRGFDPAASELDILDLELELNLFRALSPTAALGAGLVVYAEGRDMAVEAVKSLEFFRNESCGKCVPCRTGSQKFVSLGTHLVSGQIAATRWKNELVPLVKEMGKAIELASICGLGRSVPMPLSTVINFFPDDLAAHLAAPTTPVLETQP